MVQQRKTEMKSENGVDAKRDGRRDGWGERGGELVDWIAVDMAGSMRCREEGMCVIVWNGRERLGGESVSIYSIIGVRKQHWNGNEKWTMGMTLGYLMRKLLEVEIS